MGIAKNFNETNYDMFYVNESEIKRVHENEIMHGNPFVASGLAGMSLVPPYSGLGHAGIMPPVIPKPR